MNIKNFLFSENIANSEMNFSPQRIVGEPVPVKSVTTSVIPTSSTFHAKNFLCGSCGSVDDVSDRESSLTSRSLELHDEELFYYSGCANVDLVANNQTGDFTLNISKS